MYSDSTEKLTLDLDGSVSFAPADESDINCDVQIENVTPNRTEWLPELLEELLPWIVDAVNEAKERHSPHKVGVPRAGMIGTILYEMYDITATHYGYSLAAGRFAAHVENTPIEDWLSEPEEDRLSSINTLTRVGIGKDEVSSDVDHLLSGPVRLIALGNETPTVCLDLNNDSWQNKRRSQREEGLKTIRYLAESMSIVLVMSPDVEQFLRDRHSDWIDSYLTESNNTPTHHPPLSSSEKPTTAEVYEKLKQFTSGEGRLRLLAAIPSDESIEIRELKGDETIDLSDGTIDRYYRDLESNYDFLEVDEGQYNEVRLSPGGEVAQSLLTDDYQLTHPAQSQLGSRSPTPPQSSTGIVIKGKSSQGNISGKSLENSYRDSTAKILSGYSRQQQLPPDDFWMSETQLVDMLSLGQSAEGITLINDKLTEFEDGRTTFLGHADGEAHVVVQWGGPLPTLVRLGATLLSDQAFDEILTRTAVESLLKPINSHDVLRLGRQLGWLSDDEDNYDSLRARYDRVGTTLLQQIGKRGQSEAVWSRLARDAHGLLASATSLYHAIDVDLTIHLRVPDTDQLTRERARYKQFLDFLKHTVSKNATYSGNSASRMLLENDGEKLGYRLPVEIDDSDPYAELTANWVITGRNATSLREDIHDALQSVEVREQVASGNERGIQIPIDVADGNTYSRLQESICELLDRLDRDLVESLSIDQLTRMYLFVFDNIEQDFTTCSPHTVREAILATDTLVSDQKPLSIEDLLCGVGCVSTDQIYPWLPPSAREMMRVLFRYRSSLQRSEILDRGNLSTSSYERYRGVLDRAGFLWEPEHQQYKPAIPGQWERQNSLEKGITDDRVSEWVVQQRFLKVDVLMGYLLHCGSANPHNSRIDIG